MTGTDRGLSRESFPRLGTLGALDDRPAVIEPGRGRITYADLDRLANCVTARLRQLAVEPGARIGIYTRRSSDAIAAMLGTLRAGCTYVPVDPGAPIERNAEIHTDCGVHATIVEERFEAGYRAAVRQLGGKIDIQSIGPVGLGRAIQAWAPESARFAPEVQVERATPQSQVACILYTSGSTGRHKGWMMSRTAIEVLVRWGRGLLQTGERDIFANHAPFNFGMSLFDIYSSLTCGASLLLVPDEVRQYAPRVVDIVSRERVTIWFFTPAILSRIAAMDDLEAHDLTALRFIMFGGEVFPAPPLNALRRRLPHPRYFNCWGSTETNIATYYELPPGVELDAPPPIGRPLISDN